MNMAYMSMCKIDKFYKISKYFIYQGLIRLAVHMGTFPRGTGHACIGYVPYAYGDVP